MKQVKKRKLKIGRIIIALAILVAIVVLLIFLFNGTKKLISKEVTKYLANDNYTVTLYDYNSETEELAENKTVARGFEVKAKMEDVINKDNNNYVKITFDKESYYVLESNLVDNKEDAVKEEYIYVRTPASILESLDDPKIVDQGAKGEKMEVLSYDSIDENGKVNTYKVKTDDNEGYIYGKYIEITEEEAKIFSRSQLGTLKGRGHNIKYLPYVFTEQGVAMLATVLRTSVAEEVSIRIMDAFVAMRRYISTNLLEQKYINDLVLKDSKRIDLLEETFASFKEQNNHIFFEGQIYDAYSLMIKIFEKAESSIIIIDNYIDKDILDILSKTKKQVTLITNKYKIQDYEKYKEQYNNVTLVVNNSFHDRFIILDKRILYHSGASFKDLGKKCFAITRIESKEILDSLLNKLEN